MPQSEGLGSMLGLKSMLMGFTLRGHTSFQEGMLVPSPLLLQSSAACPMIGGKERKSLSFLH